MQRGFQVGEPAARAGLKQALARLDALVNLERADRSAGAPGADALRRAGLEPMRDLCARLAAPERAFRAVHVAGTKGKGSVSTFLAHGLLRAGFSVGLYTSPHVSDVCERLAIGGRLVPPGVLARHLERALDARAAALRDGTAGGNASWFDVFTAAAFDAFAAARVAWAVVEVGLGGRLDSTNVVHGEVGIVTNIDLEHTAILGSTRAAIAAEKAGIFKPGASALTGVPAQDDEVAPVLAACARAAGALLVHVDLQGEIRERNRRLAGAALAALGERGVRDLYGTPLGPALLSGALPRLPGRRELRRVGSIPVVLDGAHVASSLRALLADLGHEPEFRGPAVVVLGMGRDKDAPGLLKALAGRADRVLCTSAGSGPYRTPEELSEEATRVGLEAEPVSTAADALDRALRSVRPGGWVLVTGSLHLVGAVRDRLPPAAEEAAC
jgi:dihydrofolate synthase/folylpolyglutamate synthase